MQTRRHFITGILLAAVASVVTARVATAQDPAKVAPDHYTVIFENERVRVLDSHSKPGETVAMHSHPTTLVYFFTSGKAKFTGSDGMATEVEGTAGQVLWLGPTAHAVTNTGTTEVHVLVIEFRE